MTATIHKRSRSSSVICENPQAEIYLWPSIIRYDMTVITKMTLDMLHKKDELNIRFVAIRSVQVCR